jgi:hypothetical protein
MADEWRELKLAQIIQPPLTTRFDILISRLTGYVAGGAGYSIKPEKLYPVWGRHLLEEPSPLLTLDGEEWDAYVADRRALNLAMLNPQVIPVVEVVPVDQI